MVGSVTLKMTKPRASFVLAISGGSIDRAEFRLDGGSKLEARMEAATAAGRSVSGYSPPLGLNLDFSIPVGTFLGVPFYVGVTQQLNVQAFMPGTASVVGVGDYTLTGALGFSYANGSLKNATGATFDASTSLTGTNSLAVGISGVTADYRVKFSLGLGMFGFTAGLHFTLTVQTALTIGMPIGYNVGEYAESPIMQCKTAQASVWVTYGIGYSIPKPVVALVNWFLRNFGTTPIQASGGKSAAEVPILTSFTAHPDVPICRN